MEYFCTTPVVVVIMVGIMWGEKRRSERRSILEMIVCVQEGVKENVNKYITNIFKKSLAKNNNNKKTDNELKLSSLQRTNRNEEIKSKTALSCPTHYVLKTKILVIAIPGRSEEGNYYNVAYDCYKGIKKKRCDETKVLKQKTFQENRSLIEQG